MSAEDSKIAENSVEQNDEWIVQSKPRRLVPQHSLSRQDLEADKSKVAPAAVDTKKKGELRWTLSIRIFRIRRLTLFVYS